MPTMSDFRHETSGRRAITIISLALMLFVGAYGVNKGMLQDEVGILVAIIWLASTALVGWMVIFDPKSGIEVSSTGISWWNGKDSGFVTPTELDRFEIRDWSDSTDYHLRLKDGTSILLSGIVDVDHDALSAALSQNQMALSIR